MHCLPQQVPVVDCMVCLGALEDDDVGGRVLPRCKHAFHAGCIGEWLTSHSVCCPICRTAVWSDEASTAVDASSVAVAVSSNEEAGFAGGDTTDVSTNRGGRRFDVHVITDELHLAILLLY